MGDSRRHDQIHGVHIRPCPDLRIILTITGINKWPLQGMKHIGLYFVCRPYSCAQISMTDAGFR